MNNNEIFTPEEDNANEEGKCQLIKLIASGEAIVLVGAGSSKRVGYPDWDGLLKKLVDKTNDFGFDFRLNPKRCKKSPLIYAEDIKTHICNRDSIEVYHCILDKVLEPATINPNVDNFHKMLVSLPFKAILTTNYDLVLEAALESVGIKPAHNNSLTLHQDYEIKLMKFVRSLSKPKTPRKIVHLHGIYDNPKTIILTSEDYKVAYGYSISEETDVSKRLDVISRLILPGVNPFERIIIPTLSELIRPMFGTSFNISNTSKNEGNLIQTIHQRLLKPILSTRSLVFLGFSLEDPYFNKMLKTVCEDMMEWGESIHYAIMDISHKDAGKSKSVAIKRKQKYGIDTVFYKVDHDLEEPYKELDKLISCILKGCGLEIPIIGEISDDQQSVSDEEWLEQNNRKA